MKINLIEQVIKKAKYLAKTKMKGIIKNYGGKGFNKRKSINQYAIFVNSASSN